MAPAPSLAPGVDRDVRRHQILAAQVRLLYDNVNVAVAVTLTAAAALGAVLWSVSSHAVIVGWCGYMFAVSGARFLLGRWYGNAGAADSDASRRLILFALGAALTGIGWGGAGILLYPPASLLHQTLLIFVLGGMMLGGASILAPRPEAFIAFMLPTGLALAASLAVRGDTEHAVMGFLAVVFTLATLVTTWRIHRMITSSLDLKFENQHLVEDLQWAKDQADALNQHLEVRVRERTAELHHSTEQLRAEIAHRMQIEEELLRTKKLESLGVLAGGIAHDFNNFLTIVQGNIELAKMRLEATDPVLEVLDQTTSACRRAALLSSQLLTFAKGGGPIRRLTPVSRLVADAVEHARADASHAIQTYIPEDLHFAEVDAGQINQAIQNILLNARQATPEGGIVEVAAENVTRSSDAGPQPFVRISIQDHGHGIPADVLPRVFDPYFTTKTGASGLGLATAYAVIAKHGGTLTVESEVGAGAVFRIELPAKLGPPVASPAVAVPARVVSTPGAVRRILVMDDEDSLRRLLRDMLTKFGYEVETARDGAEAIEKWQNATASGPGFDVVLLDLTVSGGMGGEEAAARLRELDPNVRLVVSSGYSDSPVMADFHKYGFEDVLPKPWTAADLRELIARLLGPGKGPKSRT